MSSGVETVQIIDPWIYATLAADAALAAVINDRLIGTLAEAAVEAPYVSWFMSSARDITVAAGIERVQVEAIYTVKAVCEGASWDPVTVAAARLDALLPTKNTVTAHGCISCRRESTIQYAEVDGGTQYRHLGASFRIWAYSL